MEIWKLAFNKFRKSAIPNEFLFWVEKSIQLLGSTSGELDDATLQDHLKRNGIPEFEAGEILIFLPTVFCRRFLPEIGWKAEYIDFYSTNKQIARKFNENERYKIIEKAAERYFNSDPKREVVLKIAGRSPEFKSVITLLKNGSNPEDIDVSEPFVVRYE